MTEFHPFVDHYGVLQVDPTCDQTFPEMAYRHLAKRYHPDRSETADTPKFQAVMEAYRVLRQPDERAEYDRLYAANTNGSFFESPSALDERPALSDAEAHTKMLMSLYRRRREQAQDPGVIAYHLREMLGCSEELFDFHVWYLKSKGLIDTTEQGTVAITVEGVDHVIALSRNIGGEKLMIARSNNGGAEPT